MCETSQEFDEKWKIVVLHHPLYSSSRTHGSQLKLRDVLEPLFKQHNVSVVLNGHDHAYERIKPQDGIQYFVEGSSGKLRVGDLRQGSPLTAFGTDTVRTFMLMEIDGDTLTFNTINMQGNVIDSGTIAAENNRALRHLGGASSRRSRTRLESCDESPLVTVPNLAGGRSELELRSSGCDERVPFRRG